MMEKLLGFSLILFCLVLLILSPAAAQDCVNCDMDYEDPPQETTTIPRLTPITSGTTTNVGSETTTQGKTRKKRNPTPPTTGTSTEYPASTSESLPSSSVEVDATTESSEMDSTTTSAVEEVKNFNVASVLICMYMYTV
ncbi:hypothetical protein CAPTEDRAFT_205670 [Capitella teleta]|uniref:Uncharacterized protein n=1 Tax=Capitella teleta TaxID=283909 RepID=R7TFQ5_CAPTE|nr:hypothetical protein CAPTEDRAFT_205670 [Capitella teleta]|eukprot:ELT90361.1 hypothetical protein CAPTEDRAFT_205670 [Capitella teleta]